jgi:hypothetical protein
MDSDRLVETLFFAGWAFGAGLILGLFLPWLIGRGQGQVSRGGGPVPLNPRTSPLCMCIDCMSDRAALDQRQNLKDQIRVLDRIIAAGRHNPSGPVGSVVRLTRAKAAAELERLTRHVRP